MTKKPKNDVFGIQARINAVKSQNHKKKFNSFFGDVKEEVKPGEKQFSSMFDNNLDQAEEDGKRIEQLEKENRKLQQQIASDLLKGTKK